MKKFQIHYEREGEIRVTFVTDEPGLHRFYNKVFNHEMGKKEEDHGFICGSEHLFSGLLPAIKRARVK